MKEKRINELLVEGVIDEELEQEYQWVRERMRYIDVPPAPADELELILERIEKGDQGNR